MLEEKIMKKYFDQCVERSLMVEFEPEEKEGVGKLLSRWQIKADDKILEPGCGSGRLTKVTAKQIGSQGEILGMDLSEGMIGRAKLHRLPNNIEFRVGTVRAIPKPEEWFDKIICFNVFPHFADLVKIFSEFARVLKSGGELWINHLKSREKINSFHERLGPEVNKHSIPENEEVIKMIAGAGFEIMIFENNENGYCVKAIRVRNLSN
ncbi:class I SAM-dependent methyltransferase [bacterium]|nr:class I SAM-dependent methyltransferase [bacterium]